MVREPGKKIKCPFWLGGNPMKIPLIPFSVQCTVSRPSIETTHHLATTGQPKTR